MKKENLLTKQSEKDWKNWLKTSEYKPVINFENRQCGFRATKVIMKEGGVINSDFCRHPITPLEEQTKAGLINLIKKYDPIALSWGK